MTIILLFLFSFQAKASRYVDDSSIRNPIVMSMTGDHKHYYLFVKNTCGLLAPIKVQQIGLHSFEDSALATFSLNMDYFKDLWSRDGYSQEIVDLFQSPATKIALDECYPGNEDLKALYYISILKSYEDGITAGIAVNLIGASVVAKTIAFLTKKFLWSAIASRLRQLNWAQEAIDNLGLKLGIGAGTALGAAGSISIIAAHHEERDENRKFNEGAEKLFSCESDLKRYEEAIKQDIQSYSRAPESHSYWEQSCQKSIGLYIGAFKKCINKNIDSDVEKKINDMWSLTFKAVRPLL